MRTPNLVSRDEESHPKSEEYTWLRLVKEHFSDPLDRQLPWQAAKINARARRMDQFAVMQAVGEICKHLKLGYCAADKTEYVWVEEYKLWVPDPRGNLIWSAA